ncbi:MULTISPECIES: patatin-like phospholipase family protein [Vitreoscilla]|uniref:Patatin-like phospholipase family protein n=1 Tax=Vitreoscilla stercoraria TaxID=61 RepID=A0ABY4ECQ0_VITST|nr:MULTISPECIES: patatin-like phospholipase family protein [Vitreoscilla]AUZ05521.2 hypothetical protein ADP71_20690 [Vitreoscilla sp. C1]UOO93066.1 patatin-like phospholipase family protein [Vitreoscilla stercoraria]
MSKHKRYLDLALQGGGSHGAFTWGVLDALLEDGRLSFQGISGTSAGAMNAVVLAAGFAEAKIEGMNETEAHLARCQLAREKLHDFWFAVGRVGTLMAASPVSFAAKMMPWMKPMLSPVQANPFDINPLRDILNRVVDFDCLTAQKCEDWMPQLFICATNVRTGKGKIFTNQQMSSQVVMASACLPMLYQTVEVDGEPYWDGGYAGNPALYPLIYSTPCHDILLVQINPMEIDALPKSMSDIQDRANQITFNAGLLSELRAIRFVTTLLDENKLDIKKYRKIYMHQVDGGADLLPLGAESKVKSDWNFLSQLFEKGRVAGAAWLETHFDDIGKKTTMASLL